MFKFTCAALTKTGKKPVNRDNYMVGNLYVPQDHADLRNNAQGKTEQPFFVAAADGMGDEASGRRSLQRRLKSETKGMVPTISMITRIQNVIKRKLLLLLFVHCSFYWNFVCILSKTSKKQLNFHDAAFEKAVRKPSTLRTMKC